MGSFSFTVLHTYKGVPLSWKGPSMLFFRPSPSLLTKVGTDPMSVDFSTASLTLPQKALPLKNSNHSPKQKEYLQSGMLTTYFPASPTFEYNIKVSEYATNKSTATIFLKNYSKWHFIDFYKIP